MKGNAPLGRRFEKGVSGNPDGRPKTKPFTDALRKIGSMPELEVVEYIPETRFERTAKALLDAAVEGKEIVPAFREAADRLEGKPQTSVDISGSLDGPSMSEDRLAIILERVGIK